jgi:hypothetical protein
MRRALALLAGGAALGAGLARALRGRPPVAQELPPGPDPRAGELRDKLAEAREVVAEREEAEQAETPVDEAEPTGADLAERRRKVHAHGHAVAGEMRRRSSAKRPKPGEE